MSLNGLFRLKPIAPYDALKQDMEALANELLPEFAPWTCWPTESKRGLWAELRCDRTFAYVYPDEISKLRGEELGMIEAIEDLCNQAVQNQG